LIRFSVWILNDSASVEQESWMATCSPSHSFHSILKKNSYFYCSRHTMLIRLSTRNRMPTNFETMFQFDFRLLCSYATIFCWNRVERKNQTENRSVWRHLYPNAKKCHLRWSQITNLYIIGKTTLNWLKCVVSLI
jgi:hypothetical protein